MEIECLRSRRSQPLRVVWCFVLDGYLVAGDVIVNSYQWLVERTQRLAAPSCGLSLNKKPTHGGSDERNERESADWAHSLIERLLAGHVRQSSIERHGPTVR